MEKNLHLHIAFKDVLVFIEQSMKSILSEILLGTKWLSTYILLAERGYTYIGM
jgi:hypothetical protein